MNNRAWTYRRDRNQPRIGWSLPILLVVAVMLGGLFFFVMPDESNEAPQSVLSTEASNPAIDKRQSHE
jgi:hypothetical protein